MSRERRDSFVFYRSFQEAINELSEADQLTIYRLIASYALDREEPELKGTLKLVWLLVRPQLDANWRKYDKGCRGGAPAGNTNAVKTTIGQPRAIEKQTNVNDNVNDNVNVNVKDNVKENVNVKDNIYTRFVPPILSDIEEYISEGRLSVSAENFYDYYTSNGWMVGKSPMADWRAALRNWNRKPQPENNNQQRVPFDDL